MLLCAGLLALGAGALAQTATYVFPYEGFRYTQRKDETVLTQTNLGEHEALLKALGTSSEAVLASYVASGIVMEVIPDDGGQIAVSVTDAGKFADVQDMDKMTQEQRLAFLAQFEMSGLYETCAYVDTVPACVRLTSSAMYASMPVYSLRYATLHLGKLYMIEQTIVGREPDEADDARMEQLLSGMKLLSSLGQATPTPQATATMQPTATPEPILGSAAVETSGGLTLDEIPAYTTSAQLTLSGHAAASAEIRVEEGGKQLAKTGAKKDGSFSLKVKLADYFDESRTEDIFDYIPPQKTNQIFTPKWVVKKMVDLLEQENPGCFDDPGKTFLDPYMKSGLYITEIVKRLYRSEKMRQAFPDDNARLEHIFARQVYGLAPTEIIYRIAISYILGFAKDHGITAHHIRQADTLEFAKAGTMERKLDKIFRD